jgi:hypothetical protein
MQKENILDEVYNFLGEFVVNPNDHCRVVVTLWIVHTHLMDAFYYAPRLHITSATSGCGKTTLLNLTNLLVHKPMPILNPSPASLYTLIDQEHPTLLIDEIDTLFSKKDTFDITSIVNSGFDRSSQGVPRVSIEPRRVDFFNVFGPMLLSGIDKNNMPDTIENRCIQIRLRKKLSSEAVKTYRSHKHKPIGDALRHKLEAWIKDNAILEKAKAMALNDPALPEGMADRYADKWEPLFIVADVTDETDVTANSEWGKKAREAALFFLSEDKDLEPTDNSELLLKDIQDIFNNEADKDKRPTAQLLDQLNSMTEAQWSAFSYGKNLTARDLARLLKPYGIKSQTIRFKDNPVKGYYRSDFEDAWKRHLSNPSVLSVTSVTDVTSVANNELMEREHITPDALQALITPDMSYEEFQDRRATLGTPSEIPVTGVTGVTGVTSSFSEFEQILSQVS